MRISVTRGGRPVAALTGWDLKLAADALRFQLTEGRASRRAVTLLAALEAAESSNHLEPCTCGSVEHHVADCPELSRKRLRLV
ncbi:hypothetical protein [Streptomyces beijiangensis]|uniref:Uncharacterized protein n=1 Tax=Streptomyces beijiangensis TaxID=163361 RepID=A0A939FC96_9ACTN|nr:hypothetical protein [Streptomyces beijiangensis]MBO0514797.1 hypothetical protein [Streptomyces beijiangensis]